MPSQTLSQKIARQSATASTAAPSNGPRTLPSSWTAPTTPSGVPRRFAGHRSATSASVAGTSPPPNTSTGSSTETAVMAEPTTKRDRQKNRILCRATRSESLPISGRTAMYPSRKPEMIGVARCSSSMLRPTPAIMSGSATTTTYVSAEASATASDAVASCALGLTDLNRRAVRVQRERVCRCRTLVERAGHGHGAQLPARVGDAVGDVEGPGGVSNVEQLCHTGSGQRPGDGLEDVGPHPGARAFDRILRVRQQRGDASLGGEQVGGIRRVVRLRIGLDELGCERQLHIEQLVDRDHVDLGLEPTDSRVQGPFECRGVCACALCAQHTVP